MKARERGWLPAYMGETLTVMMWLSLVGILALIGLGVWGICWLFQHVVFV